MSVNRPVYSPALRMKAGELGGVAALAGDVAQWVLPRFVAPPRPERDRRQPELLVTEKQPDFSRALAKHWHGRDALIDLTYIIDECGRDRIDEWLPQSFQRARRSGGRPIPAASIDDLADVQSRAFAAAVDRNALLQFAVRIPFDRIGEADLSGKVCAALAHLELAIDSCAVIADFSDAEFSDASIVAHVIGGALDALQDIGAWRHVIFQGSNYPEKNPAQPNSSQFWLRNEWAAWKDAVKFDLATIDSLMFGDFAADCSTMKFGISRARAIPHYRYSTEDAWLVERGQDTGSDRANMRAVCKRIVESGHFAGADFSAADEFIERTSNGGDPGSSTMWRQVNTTHHITRVVTDIAAVRNILIRRRKLDRSGLQLDFLSEIVAV